MTVTTQRPSVRSTVAQTLWHAHHHLLFGFARAMPSRRSHPRLQGLPDQTALSRFPLYRPLGKRKQRRKRSPTAQPCDVGLAVADHGLFVESKLLRHANIKQTAEPYADCGPVAGSKDLDWHGRDLSGQHVQAQPDLLREFQARATAPPRACRVLWRGFPCHPEKACTPALSDSDGLQRGYRGEAPGNHTS